MEPGPRPAGSSCGSPAGLSREYKLVMLGAGGVGKSAMTMQFISHRFPEDHDPTIVLCCWQNTGGGKRNFVWPFQKSCSSLQRLRILLSFLDYEEAEDAYKIRIRIDDEPANLDILDTAGQAEFTAMRDQYMRAGEGFIICYSITDRRSFHEVREFKQLIYRVRRTDDTPVVLVGNKSDLKQLRQVTKEEGLALAREFSCPFFETSAAYRYYIDDVFHALVREIRRKEKEAVLAMEKKSKPKTSVWKRLKSPFRKKKDSVT
uniref:GTP-binding protein Rit1 isoform X1 n=1 Tax=Halichoerus grypus TaxID=9711 RepID=UPI001658EBF8|nr:GTP-binding protein Rit1 isoform X1 [Halichoerus grypus]